MENFKIKNEAWKKNWRKRYDELEAQLPQETSKDAKAYYRPAAFFFMSKNKFLWDNRERIFNFEENELDVEKTLELLKEKPGNKNKALIEIIYYFLYAKKEKINISLILEVIDIDDGKRFLSILHRLYLE